MCVEFHVARMQTKSCRSCPHHIKDWAGLVQGRHSGRPLAPLQQHLLRGPLPGLWSFLCRLVVWTKLNGQLKEITWLENDNWSNFLWVFLARIIRQNTRDVPSLECPSQYELNWFSHLKRAEQVFHMCLTYKLLHFSLETRKSHSNNFELTLVESWIARDL